MKYLKLDESQANQGLDTTPFADYIPTMEAHKFSDFMEIPKDFTGIAEIAEHRDTHHRIVWMKNGKVHRDDGPACVYLKENFTGHLEWWYINNNLVKFPINIQTNEDKIRFIKNKNFW